MFHTPLYAPRKCTLLAVSFLFPLKVAPYFYFYFQIHFLFLIADEAYWLLNSENIFLCAVTVKDFVHS